MVQPTPFMPQSWGNQPLVLYHGTLDIHVFSILRAVDVGWCRQDTDFGRGFYTTTVERQAHTWALRKAARRSGCNPAVIRFIVGRDDLAELDTLWFVRGAFNAEDFWSLVFHCRAGEKGHLRKKRRGWYDVVVGPATASWEQQLTLVDVDQVSFHTKRAAQLLDRSQPERVI
jgi:hypothetical protein